MGQNDRLTLGVVGPCGAGKTTLISGLQRYGYYARHIAQEHSYVPSMWQKLTHPDILIYLHASYPTTIERRALNWNQAEYNEQLRRLQHAYEHADLRIDTDWMTPQQVLETVLSFLKSIE
jgi:guanylate kinase